jgi:DNA polymerase-1
MSERLVADTETNGLLDRPNLLLHCIQIGTLEGTDTTLYTAAPPTFEIEGVSFRPIAEGVERLRAAALVVGHNFLGFDLHVLDRFYPGALDRHRVLDTLVMARLAQPDQRDHRLEAWGIRTGVGKDDYKGDYQTFDLDFATYSAQDIRAGRAVWEATKHVLDWGVSCALEHDVAWWIGAQERNGFRLDIPAAQALDIELRGQLGELEASIRSTFPPFKRSETFVPKVDNKTRGYVKGVAIEKTWAEEFNPGSRRHIAEALQAQGWKPTAFGDNGAPTVDEVVLATLSSRYPIAAVLSEFFTTQKKLGQLSDGKNGWLKHVKADGRVYGRVNPNGAVTGRMSHSAPNMANVDKDPRMRSLWLPRDGWDLVGCDAEGLEARMLAHYLAKWDDGAFADRLLNGKKEDRTDIHSANFKELVRSGVFPMVSWKEHFKEGREAAKTILYALMYGAGNWKLGATAKDFLRDLKLPLGIKESALGEKARKAIATSIVGLDKLTDAVMGASASRGYLVSLDGRHVICRSPHSALNTLLQGGGAVVMKKALSIFCNDGSTAAAMGAFWGLCANVHDEVQMEVMPDLAASFGQCFALAITQAGEFFKLRCPLAGAYAVGKNWSETH